MHPRTKLFIVYVKFLSLHLNFRIEKSRDDAANVLIKPGMEMKFHEASWKQDAPISRSWDFGSNMIVSVFEFEKQNFPIN
jgi:hypothetical protein